MEIGIVTKSREALLKLAANNDFDPDDVYIISCLQDLNFMKKEVGDQDYMILLAEDYTDTGVKQSDIAPSYEVGSLGVKFDAK